MGNTVTGLINDVYAALNIVSREMVGFIPAVTVDGRANRAALNQSVTVPIAPAVAGENITPAMYPPSTGAVTMGYEQITITNSRAFPFVWTGEEQRSITEGGGPGFLTVRQNQIAEAIRAAINEIEADLGNIYKGSSRAYGTPTTAPFGTAGDFSDFAAIAKILDDNGCPETDRRMVLGSAAVANIRGKQSGLFEANRAGNDVLLRTGALGEVEGFMLGKSAGVKLHTKGTGTNYQSNLLAGYGIGDTTIAVDTGANTCIAGDTITWTGDTNKYVVKTALSGGNLTIARPGLMQTLADNIAMTIGGTYTANMAFSKSAIVLAVRPPVMPDDGDQGEIIEMVQDPVSGLVFELRRYKGYHQNRYEIGVCWGWKVIKEEHVATLLG